MNIKDFKKSVERTMKSNLSDKEAMTNYSMGLAGEAGEVLDLHKKFVFHNHPLDDTKLLLELGDVAFYLMALCITHGYDLEIVFAANAEKLRKRFPNGFNTVDSIERVDKDG